MNFQNQRHTLVGFVGHRPMVDFDGKTMDNTVTHERTLKRGLRRFAPSPENLWNAASEAVSVIGQKVGLERLMVWQHTTRLLHRRAVENMLTKEMFPDRSSEPDMAPILQEVQNLKTQRRMSMGMRRT